MNFTGNIEHYKLPRNFFDLSKTRLSSYKIGYIYPVWSEYMLPNDTVDIKIENVTRQLPTVSPSYSNNTVIYRTFFVALRNIWDKFPQWLTGFKQYNKAIKFEEDVPRWTPSSAEVTRPGSLWTSLGFPMNTLPHKMPADFKRQAYAYIYDKYFRYQPFMDSILNEEQEPGSWTGEDLLQVVRDRDYFTTGLPAQQLGDPLALPIVGNASANFGTYDVEAISILGKARGGYVVGNNDPTAINKYTNKTLDNIYEFENAKPGDYVGRAIYTDNDSSSGWFTKPLTTTDTNVITTPSTYDLLNKNTVDLSNLSSVTIAMLREAIQIQLFREMLARAGVYYDDVLVLNWGTKPSDETLGYPIYVGGSKINLITSEVLQTSASTNEQPLGQLGGHGLGVGESNNIRYTAKEFGVIMTLMYIKTNNIYGMQHLNKNDLFESNLDIPWIMLQHLSEQPVKCHELFCATQKPVKLDSNNKRQFVEWTDVIQNADTAKLFEEQVAEYNEKTLMYREIFDSWRYPSCHTEVDGLFSLETLITENNQIQVRKNYYNWSEALFFSIWQDEKVTSNQLLFPLMNEDFLNLKTDNRNFSVIDTELNHLASDNFMMYTKVKAHFWRTLDMFGTPGRVDHIS